MSISGERRDVTIDDVERALGPRLPDFESSQKVFRYAFFLLTRRDRPATSNEIAHLEEIRNAFAAFFNERTLGRATILTDVAP